MDGYLAQVPLFQGLSAMQVKHLAERCELRRFHKGQMLFQEGQSADSIWLIQRGWVYLIRRTPIGTQATIYTVTPEDGLCGFSTVVGEGSYFATAVAATDTTAIRIPKEEFTHLLKQQPTFAGAVLAIYHSRMRHLAEAISLASSPVERRLAYTLLRLKHSFGKTIPVTHQELARMAGTRWETSIRTIAAFRRKHWLSTSRGKMTILRPDRLNTLLKSSTREGDGRSSDGKGP